ncbi:MAG: DUF2971 domain-containing protein [Prevotella sp.]|nr:DUF2971 domain-containing protein [Prevotella sp.]
MKHYFKYKSLKGDSFKYFVRMLIESKMYASSFKKLNDPMEGAFLADEKSRNYLQSQKDEMKIISLIEKKAGEFPCNMLMWSHYCDEHRGCCIEFHFQNKEDEARIYPVNYVDEIKQGDVNSVEDVLSRKFEDWKYEQEVRHLGTEEFVPILIDTIYLGMRIDDMYNDNDHTNEDFYRELLTCLCPNVEVVKMQAEVFDGHHLDTLKE